MQTDHKRSPTEPQTDGGAGGRARNWRPVVGEICVPRASQAEAALFDAGIENAMMQMSGPPTGLMVHFARADGDGFMLCNGWRTEDDMRPFYDAVVLPDSQQPVSRRSAWS